MKTLVFDLDGTMYRGTAIIESAKEYLDYCIENKIPFVFLTNNSMRTRQQNVEHMEKMGYTNICAEMFFNSAMAACIYAKDMGLQSAYYIGQDGLKEAMEQSSIVYDDKNPDVVFVGLDKMASYQSYSKALKYLLQGAKLIGTNKDRILASPDGFEMGNGSIVTMFEYASSQTSPDIAKPSSLMLDLCLKHFHLKKEDIILIGDNLETDIKLGYDNGVQSVFVQSGVHTKNDIEKFKVYPTYTIEKMTDLLEIDFLN